MRLAPLTAVVVLVCLPLVVQATPLEMVANGSFEEELDVGWVQRPHATYSMIQRTTTGDPDPEFEVQLYINNGVGELGVAQRFPVHDLDLTITFSLAASADGTGGAWAASGVRLVYRDRDWSILGESRFVYASADCPWTGTPTLHLTEIGLDEWQTFEFTLADELDQLPGVDPGAIEWMEVEVMAEAENC